MMKLTIWSDFACPYCYIGETRLQKAIEEAGLKGEVDIDFRAFELDPNASKEVVSDTPERFAKKYRLSLDDPFPDPYTKQPPEEHINILPPCIPFFPILLPKKVRIPGPPLKPPGACSATGLFDPRQDTP